DEMPEVSEDEADSDFGADVEPEAIPDPRRQFLRDFEDEEDEAPEESSGNDLRHQAGPTDLPRTAPSPAPPYSNLVRAFIVLVVFLTAFYGLGRQPANLLLSFFAQRVHPLLGNDPLPPPLQLSTVRAQLGLTPSLVKYAVCPDCELLALCTAFMSTCSHCNAELYERPGKPIITFSYQPLKPWLIWLLRQPGVEAALQEWRDREPSPSLEDCYDG
ncbi:hypothetical protein V8E36_002822, partial [Tilletia maclaganii]